MVTTFVYFIFFCLFVFFFFFVCLFVVVFLVATFTLTYLESSHNSFWSHWYSSFGFQALLVLPWIAASHLPLEGHPYHLINKMIIDVNYMDFPSLLELGTLKDDLLFEANTQHTHALKILEMSKQKIWGC